MQIAVDIQDSVTCTEKNSAGYGDVNVVLEMNFGAPTRRVGDVAGAAVVPSGCVR
ncbi:hypothetical protein GCM10027213_23920 [Mycobacterium bourgelatii]